ncbi:hypothetical protein AB0C29_03415 [Actinoplanes sp. NPDC048791]|uniref:hypothetical protein n=1 Tax=Actinoplanes sp. NPDC048791 TaxID=3154623 RepID=UPI0033DDE62A
MSRLRTLAGLVVLATTGLLITPAAAQAAQPPLRANITCDSQTGAVKTWASGTLFTPGTPPAPVTVEFQRRGGTVITATTSAPLASAPVPLVVKATSTSSGEVNATGYKTTFNPVTSVFYRENLLVTFKNAAGVTLTTREASCYHDRRTTVTLTCDPAAGTVTVAVAGVNGRAGAANGAGRPARVGYRFARTVQHDANDPRFRSELLGPGWDFEHRITQAADGTWSDPAFVDATITSDPYYYAEELTVSVLDTYGAVVGWGTAQCTLFDGSVTPAA